MAECRLNRVHYGLTGARTRLGPPDSFSTVYRSLHVQDPQRCLRLQPTLVRKGLLYRPTRGVVAFSAPLFGAYLRRRNDDAVG